MLYCTEFLSNYSLETPVEILWTAFKAKCSKCLELNPQCPQRNHFKAPWINAHIRQLSNMKKQAQSTRLPSDWSKYRNLKKLSQKECCKAHNQYLHHLVSPENDNNNKCLWFYIKSRRQDYLVSPENENNNKCL